MSEIRRPRPDDQGVTGERSHAERFLLPRPLASEAQKTCPAEVGARIREMNEIAPNAALARDVLNALTASIAVLDSHGVILAVNDAWIRFARANGAADEHFYVGVDYLAVCERAMDRGEGGPLEETTRGLRALLDGTDTHLSVEYPCHSPTEERWFLLRATSMPGRGAGIVVAHEDITARKRAEAELRRAKEEVEAASRELASALAREQVLARVDALTGTINRRHFFVLAAQAIAVATRYHEPLSVILFDIDDFKRANDTLGHSAGDDLLKRVARIGQQHLREADVFARYGGDEFVILLPHTRAAEASIVAERMRHDVAAQSAGLVDGMAAVTISSGIAELLPQGDSLDALIHRADVALYEAKKAGRNRTAVYSPAAPPPP